MRQADTLGIARGLVKIEAEALSGDQGHGAPLEQADPVFRALHVRHDADGAPGLRFQVTDDGDPAAVILRRAVAEIQPEHIGAAQKKTPDHVGT